MTDTKTVDTEKIIDEIQEEFEKVNIPIMDKLTLFAKVQNAIYKCSQLQLEPCEDCVSREAVFDVLNCGQDLPDRLFDMVEELPRVYLEPKVGHWIPDDTICEDTLYRCSNCDNVYYSNYGDIKDMGYNYCPNCGCQMLEG